MQRETVNERSAAWVYVKFFDEDGAPLVPTTLTYTVYDVYSGQQILPETMAPPALETKLTITPGDNAMVDSNRPVEVRRVTWTINAGQGNQTSDELLYNLKNLYRVT